MLLRFLAHILILNLSFERSLLKHDDLEEIYSELSDKFPYWDHTLDLFRN
ncbi:MAG: hypothetical protein ACEY3D_09310 [Rickettsia sp.]